MMIPTAAKNTTLVKADGSREEFWLSKSNGYRLERVVFLCGLLHLSTVATKFRDRGWIVEEINAVWLPVVRREVWYAHHRRRKWLSLVRVPPEFQNVPTRRRQFRLTRFHMPEG
jgi:hypothetical protein